MREGFLSGNVLRSATWQYLERAVARLCYHRGFSGVRLVGQTGDKGADILAHNAGKRWLIQSKYRKSGNIGVGVMDRTAKAIQFYRADIPVIATNQGFTDDAWQHQKTLMASGTPMQLWDRASMLKLWQALTDAPPNPPKAHSYQEGPIRSVVEALESNEVYSALVVMATGLGKTIVAGEAIRRAGASRGVCLRVMVLAHTNELVYQLEKAFWPLIDKYSLTTIWNGYEVPDHRAQFTFGCVDSVAKEVANTGRFPADYDVVLIDECHHAGSPTYKSLIDTTECGRPGGPFLLGLTATPWRQDSSSVRALFGEPVATVDIVEGLKNGWLSNVDYRMYTTNINWHALSDVHDLTPRGLNKTLFISEWDDAVVHKLRDTWYEAPKPRAIVFCGTIEHAVIVRDRINALAFARAEALYSGAGVGGQISQAERNRILCDFHDGYVNILCAVNILNEGIDVPDVNIVVFQRVTHSRRIFVQQLGRGLRVAEGKEKVIVLDFASDIRRIAEGLDLKSRLEEYAKYVSIGSRVRFMNVAGEDKRSEAFLRGWMEEAAKIAESGEDDHVLRFPPPLGVGEMP